MKKTYIVPVTDCEPLEMECFLAASDGVTGGLDDSLDIGYGGVDGDGNLDPSANQYHWSNDDSWDHF